MLNKKYADKLRDLMAKNNIDAIIIGPSDDLNYLTGFNVHICERLQAFFFLADGNYFHISPKMYLEEAEKNLGNAADFFVWEDSDNVLDVVEKAYQKYHLSGKTIAINSAIRGIDLIDINNRLPGKYVNGHEILELLRIRKDKEEVEKMQRAARLADEAVEEAIKYIVPGITEKDIKEKIMEFFDQKGVCLSFTPIVASGPNSSMPHYCDDSRIIQKKDIIIMDLGCQYEGYCSDITRTVFVGGVTEEEEKIYHTVLAANKAGETKVGIGVSAEEVDIAAREVITKAGYGKYFLTRTGHGIGVSVHEAPYIRTGNKQILEEGMAFSVEPGIYIKDKFGVRIEDIVVVAEYGANILNKCSKEITIIK